MMGYEHHVYYAAHGLSAYPPRLEQQLSERAVKAGTSLEALRFELGPDASLEEQAIAVIAAEVRTYAPDSWTVIDVRRPYSQRCRRRYV